MTNYNYSGDVSEPTAHDQEHPAVTMSRSRSPAREPISLNSTMAIPRPRAGSSTSTTGVHVVIDLAMSAPPDNVDVDVFNGEDTRSESLSVSELQARNAELRNGLLARYRSPAPDPGPRPVIIVDATMEEQNNVDDLEEFDDELMNDSTILTTANDNIDRVRIYNH